MVGDGQRQRNGEVVKGRVHGWFILLCWFPMFPEEGCFQLIGGVTVGFAKRVFDGLNGLAGGGDSFGLGYNDFNNLVLPGR